MCCLINLLENIVKIEFKDLVKDEELKQFGKSLLKVIRNEHSKMQNLNLDLEDLVTPTYLALKEAKEKFDPSKKVTLIQYANYLVKRRIIDYIRYFTRNKRRATLLAMNAYRSGELENGQTIFDKDVENFSCQNDIGITRNLSLKSAIGYYLKKAKNKTEIDEQIAKGLYYGYGSTALIKNLNVTKSQIDKVKEEIRKLFINFKN